jgi:hypothetical protein
LGESIARNTHISVNKPPHLAVMMPIGQLHLSRNSAMSHPKMPKTRPLRKSAFAALLATCALMALPAYAQTQPPAAQDERPGALARDAIDKMMRALSLAIENLPQYAMPELNENGDIIIRRVNPRAEKPRPRQPGSPDETRT